MTSQNSDLNRRSILPSRRLWAVVVGCAALSLTGAQATARPGQEVPAAQAAEPLRIHLSDREATGAARQDTNEVSAEIEGGAPPYAYAWEYLDGARSLRPTAPYSAATRWYSDGASRTGGQVARWRLRVTDSLSRSLPSSEVTVRVFDELVKVH